MAIDQKWVTARAAELAAIEQGRQAEHARRAAKVHEHNAFLQRVEQRYAALERGEELPPVTIPRLASISAENRAAEIAAAQAAEAVRIAALTPREVWLSTLTWPEREHIARWERINKGQQWPYAPQEVTK